MVTEMRAIPDYGIGLLDDFAVDVSGEAIIGRVALLGPVFCEAVIPPPGPPCSVLHSEPLGGSPELLCPLLTATPGSAQIAPALSPCPWPAPSQDAM